MFIPLPFLHASFWTGHCEFTPQRVHWKEFSNFFKFDMERPSEENCSMSLNGTLVYCVIAPRSPFTSKRDS